MSAPLVHLLLLLLPTLLILSTASADSVQLLSPVSTVNCSSTSFPVSLTYTAAQPSSLFVFLSNPSFTALPFYAANYAALLHTVPTATGAGLSIDVNLTSALPCGVSLDWTVILSSSVTASDNSSWTANTTTAVTTVGTPITCSAAFASLSPLPPSVSFTQFNYTLTLTLPGPARISWGLYWASQSSGMEIDYTATLVGAVLPMTWSWPDMSGVMPPTGTSLTLYATVVAIPGPMNASWHCNNTLSFVTVGANAWSDEVDFTTLPTTIAPIDTPTSSNTVHIDLFAGNTGGRVIIAQLVDSTGQVIYFNDTYAVCNTTVQPFTVSAADLYSHDYAYALNNAVWNASVTNMYWNVQYALCGSPSTVYAASGPVPVTVGPLEDAVSADHLTSPDPTQLAFVGFVLLTTNASRVLNVTLYSPSTSVIHATGTLDWSGPTSARVVAVEATLVEAFQASSADLEWLVQLSSEDGEMVSNVSEAAQAMDLATPFVDQVTFDAMADALYGTTVIQLQQADISSGHATAGYTLDAQHCGCTMHAVDGSHHHSRVQHGLHSTQHH